MLTPVAVWKEKSMSAIAKTRELPTPVAWEFVPTSVDTKETAGAAAMSARTKSTRRTSNTVTLPAFAEMRGIGRGTSSCVLVSTADCVTSEVSHCGLTSPVPPVISLLLAIPVMTFVWRTCEMPTLPDSSDRFTIMLEQLLFKLIRVHFWATERRNRYFQIA